MVAGPISVFFSYSHQDARLQTQLLTHMAGLARQSLILPWFDGQIGAGTDWRRCIEEKLGSADLILLLISSHFAASDFCCSEMERALARAAAGEAEVLPVLLRPVDWPGAPYRHLNLLPENGRPVSLWRHRDDAFASIVRGIRSHLLDVRFNNLPVPATPFVGREAELRDLEALLVEPGERLVALYGPRGTGKTRLAEQAAANLFGRFQNGVCFVSCGRIAEPAVVPCAIARVLGVKEAEGVSIAESLRQHLEARHMLLLLDGFDAPSPAAAFLPRLLESCPRLRILTTGRAPLRVRDAFNLAFPTALAPADAVHLFLQSARHRAGELPVSGQAAAEICERFHNVALAIEVVGARARELPAAGAAEVIAAGERMGRWTAAGRADASGAALAWSYGLLTAEEKRLFRRLSIFRGGCTEPTAAAVCGGAAPVTEILRSLVDKRLLRAEGAPGGDPRYRMLDVIREFAARQLGAAENLELRRSHAECFLDLVEEAEPALMSPGRGPSMRRLEAERGNLRAALAWFRAAPDGIERALRLAGALFWFWNLRAHFSEGRTLLAGLLRRARTQPATPGRAKALYALGGLAFLQGDLTVARRHLQESAASWAALGDARRRAYALVILGMVEQSRGDLGAALAHARESTAILHREGDLWGYALALNDLGNAHRARGERGIALVLYRRSGMAWRLMNDGWGLPLTLSNLGFLEMQSGDREAARLAFKEALQIQHSLDDRTGLAETLKYLADLDIRRGDDAAAERLYRESLDLNRRIGRKPFLVGCLAGLAVVAQRHGALSVAARLAGAVDSQRGAGRIMAKPIDQEQYEKVASLGIRGDEALTRARDLGARAPLSETAAWALSLPHVA
jgi:predicted ATPase